MFCFLCCFTGLCLFIFVLAWTVFIDTCVKQIMTGFLSSKALYKYIFLTFLCFIWQAGKLGNHSDHSQTPNLSSICTKGTTVQQVLKGPGWIYSSLPQAFSTTPGHSTFRNTMFSGWVYKWWAGGLKNTSKWFCGVVKQK